MTPYLDPMAHPSANDGPSRTGEGLTRAESPRCHRSGSAPNFRSCSRLGAGCPRLGRNLGKAVDGESGIHMIPHLDAAPSAPRRAPHNPTHGASSVPLTGFGRRLSWTEGTHALPSQQAGRAVRRKPAGFALSSFGDCVAVSWPFRLAMRRRARCGAVRMRFFENRVTLEFECERVCAGWPSRMAATQAQITSQKSNQLKGLILAQNER